MSAAAAVGTASGVTGAVATAAVPRQVRAEGSRAVDGYRAALGFEAMLLKQMLSQALPETGAGGLEGEEGEGGATTGAAMSPVDLSETVSEEVVGAGGLGLAKDMYQSFEGGGR